jgi:hypothetical protein
MNESKVKIELTFDEHELLVDALINACDNVDYAIPSLQELNNLPEISEIKRRYRLLGQLKDRMVNEFSLRFS